MIIRSQSRVLFAIAYGILQNRAEAEDVVQDFVKAWKTRWRVRNTEKIPAWLGTITRHRARDVARRNHTVPFPAEADEPIDPAVRRRGQTFKRRRGQRTGVISLAQWPTQRPHRQISACKFQPGEDRFRSNRSRRHNSTDAGTWCCGANVERAG